MKTNILKCVAALLAMVCIFCFPITASATSQGTDGTELEVMQPETLEIQLGESWAGVEFELKTDAGMYPGTIPVGEDGVLRVEIGGSSSYILTCMNSSVEVPVPGETVSETEAPAETDSTEGSAEPGTVDPTGETVEVTPTEGSDENAVAGIPVKHIAMFGGGLVIAIAALVGMNLHSKKKGQPEVDEDDEF